jgi:hypothetical protein
MLTLNSILRIMRSERSYGADEGSCFGVTDPSRLRPAFRRRRSRTEPVCASCKAGKHDCTHSVEVISAMLRTGQNKEKQFQHKPARVPCACRGCNPDSAETQKAT